MLRTENITAGYGKNTILEDISFSIEKGERFVVLVNRVAENQL